MRNYYLLFLVTMSVFIGGCSQEDDVNEIFASGQTWHWSGSYDTTNWENDNKFTSTLSQDDLKYINAEKQQEVFIIQFDDEGKVTGKGEGFSFSGTWSADGKDNTFHLSIKTSKTPNAGSRDATFLNEITEAQFYRGDSKIIKLFDGTKKHFIQFYPIGFRN